MSNAKLSKILIVDDEQDNLDAFLKVFGGEFQLLPASSGKEALEVLKLEPAVGVVVADQRMDEMTGVELLEAVKKGYPDIVRMVITGYSDFQVPIDAINKGDVFRYLQKPVDKESTVQALKDAMAKHEKTLEIKKSIENTKKQMEKRFLQIHESLAAGVAHHVSNALVPAKTLMTLLNEKLDEIRQGKYDAAYFETFLKEALDNVGKIEHLTQMLMWSHNSKIEEFQSTPVAELIDLKDPETENLIREKKIRIEKNVDPALPPVLVDKEKVREMLMLLIKNCAAASPKEGEINFGVQKTSQPNGYQAVEFRISYKGNGYSAEELARLFDPFYKFDEKMSLGNNGLELTHCYIIAIKHGCELKVESQPDQETTFTVSLPSFS